MKDKLTEAIALLDSIMEEQPSRNRWPSTSELKDHSEVKQAPVPLSSSQADVRIHDRNDAVVEDEHDGSFSLPARGEVSLKRKLSDPKIRRKMLTIQEQVILELIWEGFKNTEIGPRLGISVKTVEAHRANMMKKMRVSNVVQLLKEAINAGAIKMK